MEGRQRECLPDIPLDVWNEILLRVPAESLVRFKHVRKGWCMLIDSDRFVQSHLEHWRPRPAMILCKNMGRPDITLVPFRSDPRLRDCVANALAEVGTRFGTDHLRAYNSCDGLILFGVLTSVLEEQQLLVCNPITKSLVLLPDRDDWICAFEWAITRNDGSSDQEYKIIGIPINYPTRCPRPVGCLVFDLCRGGGRAWKVVHMDSPWDRSSRLSGPVLSVGRKVHWLIGRVPHYPISEPVVASLDLSTERMSHTKIPCDVPEFAGGWTHVALYSDTVMCWLRRTRFSEDLELWVVEDLESQPVWRKRLVLERPPPEVSSSSDRDHWTGIYMEAEGEIAMDDGLVYSASSGMWSKIIDFDTSPLFRHMICPHVNSLVKFDYGRRSSCNLMP